MDDQYCKAYLHDDLRTARAAMLDRLDGLSDVEARRPLVPSGTNLLGLIKHLALWESRYLGHVFDRPCPEPYPAWDDAEHWGADFAAAEGETRDDIVARFHRVAAHADATIDELPLDAPGHVPWWPRPDVMLFNVLVHRIGETNRHAGHADILREQTDGHTG